MRTPPFTVRLASTAARLTDLAAFAAAAVRRCNSGEPQDMTLHPEDYAAMPPEFESRVRNLIHA